MNKLSISLLVAAAASMAACTEIEHGVNDMDSWKPIYQPQEYTLNHPCLLHSSADIKYVREHLTQSPWAEAYQQLAANSFAQTSYKASPKEWIARLDANNWEDGGGRWTKYGVEDKWYPGVQNSYGYLMRDAAAAYQLALRYVLTDDADCACAARDILVEWATVNKGMIFGTKDSLKGQLIDPNEILILFQIYQVANAAELLRDFNGWGNTDDYRKVVDWLKTYYYPVANDFIKYSTGTHYWLNWDLAAMTTVLSIGVLDDNQDMINDAILYFKNGTGAGMYLNAAPFVHADPDGTGESLAQCNESGRDQGHATLCAALMGIFCQMTLNVGEDLFAWDDYRMVAMAEYIAKYNVSLNAAGGYFPYNNIPYSDYTFGTHGTMTHISSEGRGTSRPGWDLWVGYCNERGIPCKYATEFAEAKRPDGGGGHYGGNSGGFDQSGFSTLMHYRPVKE